MKRIVSILIAVVMLTACVVSVATNAFAEQAAEATYVKAATTTLENGDKVIVYNPANGVAMSQKDVSETNADYRQGVVVPVADGKITTADATIVWTVNVTDEGYEFVGADNKKLYCTADGKLRLGDTNTGTVWGISNATTEGCVYLTSTTVTGNEGDYRTIEWYKQKKDFSVFFIGKADESLFAMQLFVLEESAAETSTETSSVTSTETSTETSSVASSDASTETSSVTSTEASSDASTETSSVTSTEASADTSSTTEPAGPDLGDKNANALFATTLNATVKGNTVTVKVGVKDVKAENLATLAFHLYYDSTKVEPVVKNNPKNDNAAMDAFLTKKPGDDWNDVVCFLEEDDSYYDIAFLSASATTGMTADNIEVTVTFTVKEGAEGDITFYIPHESVYSVKGTSEDTCPGNGVATVAVPAEGETSTDTSSVAAPEASSATSSDAGTPGTGDAGVAVVAILAVVAAFGSAVVVKARR